MSEQDKAMYRRLFAGYRLHEQFERQRARDEPIDPAACRASFDAMWADFHERRGRHCGDTPDDDAAESRVARAVASVQAPVTPCESDG
jgi:hypothetical protein